MAVRASVLDVAWQMTEPTFRGVAFEVKTWVLSFDQGQAAHLYPDRDAGHIEGTGRNPAVYTFTSPFRNGIFTTDGPLYPDRWRLFAEACALRTTGYLVHPELGAVKVKCRSFRTTFDCERGRDGVDVDVEFIETSDESDELSKLFASSSPIVSALSAAGALDESVADANPAPKYPDEMRPSALEMIKKLQGAMDQFKLGLGNLGSAIDGALGALASFSDTVSSLDDASSYPILASIDALYTSVVNLSLTATANSRAITLGRAASTTTPDQVAKFFGMSMDDLFKLNPALADSSTVKKDTEIFIYA